MQHTQPQQLHGVASQADALNPRLHGILVITLHADLIWSGWLNMAITIPTTKLCRTVANFFKTKGESQNSSYLDAGNFAAAATLDNDVIVIIICTTSCPETEVLLKAREISHALKLMCGEQLKQYKHIGDGSPDSAPALLDMLLESTASSSSMAIGAKHWLASHGTQRDVSDYLLEKLKTLSPCSGAFSILQETPGFICAHFIDVTDPGEVLLSHWVQLEPSAAVSHGRNGSSAIKKLRNLGKDMMFALAPGNGSKPKHVKTNPAAVTSIQQLMARQVSSLWTLVMREAQALALQSSQARRTVTVGAAADASASDICTIDLSALVPEAVATISLVQLQHYEAAFVVVYTTPGGLPKPKKGAPPAAFHVTYGMQAVPAAAIPHMRQACEDVKARFPVNQEQLVQQIWPTAPILKPAQETTKEVIDPEPMHLNSDSYDVVAPIQTLDEFSGPELNDDCANDSTGSRVVPITSRYAPQPSFQSTGSFKSTAWADPADVTTMSTPSHQKQLSTPGDVIAVDHIHMKTSVAVASEASMPMTDTKQAGSVPTTAATSMQGDTQQEPQSRPSPSRKFAGSISARLKSMLHSPGNSSKGVRPSASAVAPASFPSNATQKSDTKDVSVVNESQVSVNTGSAEDHDRPPMSASSTNQSGWMDSAAVSGLGASRKGWVIGTASAEDTAHIQKESSISSRRSRRRSSLEQIVGATSLDGGIAGSHASAGFDDSMSEDLALPGLSEAAAVHAVRHDTSLLAVHPQPQQHWTAPHSHGKHPGSAFNCQVTNNTTRSIGHRSIDQQMGVQFPKRLPARPPQTTIVKQASVAGAASQLYVMSEAAHQDLGSEGEELENTYTKVVQQSKHGLGKAAQSAEVQQHRQISATLGNLASKSKSLPSKSQQPGITNMSRKTGIRSEGANEAARPERSRSGNVGKGVDSTATDAQLEQHAQLRPLPPNVGSNTHLQSTSRSARSDCERFDDDKENDERQYNKAVLLAVNNLGSAQTCAAAHANVEAYSAVHTMKGKVEPKECHKPVKQELVRKQTSHQPHGVLQDAKNRYHENEGGVHDVHGQDGSGNCSTRHHSHSFASSQLANLQEERTYSTSNASRAPQPPTLPPSQRPASPNLWRRQSINGRATKHCVASHGSMLDQYDANHTTESEVHHNTRHSPHRSPHNVDRRNRRPAHSPDDHHRWHNRESHKHRRRVHDHRRTARRLDELQDGLQVPCASDLLTGSLLREEERRLRLHLMQENLSLRQALETAAYHAPMPYLSISPKHDAWPYNTAGHHWCSPSKPAYAPYACMHAPTSPQSAAHHSYSIANACPLHNFSNTCPVHSPSQGLSFITAPTHTTTCFHCSPSRPVTDTTIPVIARPQPHQEAPVLIASPGKVEPEPYKIWQCFNGSWYRLCTSGEWVKSAAPVDSSSDVVHTENPQNNPGAIKTTTNLSTIAAGVADEVCKRLQQHLEMMHTLQSGMPTATVRPTFDAGHILADWTRPVRKDLQFYQGIAGDLYCCNLDGTWFRIQCPSLTTSLPAA